MCICVFTYSVTSKLNSIVCTYTSTNTVCGHAYSSHLCSGYTEIQQHSLAHTQSLLLFFSHLPLLFPSLPILPHSPTLLSTHAVYLPLTHPHPHPYTCTNAHIHPPPPLCLHSTLKVLDALSASFEPTIARVVSGRGELEQISGLAAFNASITAEVEEVVDIDSDDDKGDDIEE